MKILSLSFSVCLSDRTDRTDGQTGRSVCVKSFFTTTFRCEASNYPPATEFSTLHLISDLLQIETALPEIQTAMPEIVTDLPEIETDLLEI